MKMKRRVILVLSILCLFAWAPVVDAAGTRIWNFQEIETWLQGEFYGTGLTSRGEIVPTVMMDSVDLPSRLAWDSVSSNETTWIGTALPAGILRIGPEGDTDTVLSLNQLGVTALYQDNGTIYAGTSPGGEIYRHQPNSDGFEKLAVLSDSYVWGFTGDPEGDGVYIATGPDGSLYRMTSGGGVSRVGEVPGHNLMDLVVHRGTLYMGDDLGGLYRLETSGADRPSIQSVYGFPQGEISSLTSDGHHLYMAVNIRQMKRSEQKQEQRVSQLAEQLRQQSMQTQSRQQPRPSPQSNVDGGPMDPSMLNPQGDLPQRGDGPRLPESRADRRTMLEAIRSSAERGQTKLFAGLTGTLVYRMDPPSQMNIVYNDPEEIVHDLAAERGTVYIATGGNGRLYRVEEDFTRTAYFQTDQKNLLSVRLENGEPIALTTGEGAAFYEKSSGDKTPYYRSAPIDAQLLSRWGTLKSVSRGPLQFRTRSGNAETPNELWNSWGSLHEQTPFSIGSRPARFLQFEARFPERTGELENVQIAYRIPNQQPQIGALGLSDNPNRMPITQPTLTTSQEQQSSRQRNGGRSPDQHGAGSPNDQKIPIRQIQWNVVDPDGDQLETTLSYRTRDSSHWLELSEPQVRNEGRFNWDTTDFSDGWYLIRLTASDQAENPPGEGYQVHKQAGPVLVDNTSPEIKSVRRENGQIHFKAHDTTSWIIRAEYRINGEAWKPLAPVDGIFDQQTERFQMETKTTGNNGTVVELRVMDEGGNRTLRRISAP